MLFRSGEGVSFWPLVEIVRQVAGPAPLEGIRELLASEEEGDLIAERVGAAIGHSESAGEAETTSWAVRKFLEALARRHALILVFDDLHWAEPSFLDLIEYLVDWTVDAPMLLLCLSRPELLADRSAWAGGRANVLSIALEPLTEVEIGRAHV